MLYFFAPKGFRFGDEVSPVIRVRPALLQEFKRQFPQGSCQKQMYTPGMDPHMDKFIHAVYLWYVGTMSCFDPIGGPVSLPEIWAAIVTLHSASELEALVSEYDTVHREMVRDVLLLWRCVSPESLDYGRRLKEFPIPLIFLKEQPDTTADK